MSFSVERSDAGHGNVDGVLRGGSAGGCERFFLLFDGFCGALFGGIDGLADGAFLVRGDILHASQEDGD